ncbi:MAG: glycosyltransferase family 39 protein [Candidatus Eremiobacteraeota bacterium]|nr:glycosyltransferase family 39 protein [Candidatus Eremiobacteraeota bacterium]MBV8375250.1 glycosyltransferase family 39 protein [Candidatus Eremiobacteraeota bacterium]
MLHVRTERPSRWTLYGIVAVAALIRLPSLLHDGLFRDEANAFIVVSAPSLTALLHRIAAIEWHPPLYFLIAYFWIRGVGTSELALKGLPFLFSLITVPLVYRLARTVGSPAVGLIAAGVFAVSPLAVSYSTSYLYPMTGLLFVLLAYVVALARREQVTVARLGILALVTMLVAYAHYAALFYLPALVAWAIFSPRGLRHGAMLALAMLVGWLPFLLWLPVFLHQQQVGVPYQSTSSVADRAAFFLTSLVLLVPVRAAMPEWPMFFCIAAMGFFARARTILTSAAPATGAIFLVVLFLVSASGLVRIRYALPAYGLQCVFLAWLVCGAWKPIASERSARLRRWAATIAAALIVLFACGDFYQALASSAIPKSGIRSFVTEGLPGDTLYVLAPDYLAPTFAYYTRRDPVPFLGFARIEHPESFTLDGYAKLWKAPGAVNDALAAIAGEAREYRYLDVIVDEISRDEGPMPYAKTWALLGQLKSRYRLSNTRRFAGVWEPIAVYQFDLRVHETSQRD